jgi:hypothetical protein
LERGGVGRAWGRFRMAGWADEFRV